MPTVRQEPSENVLFAPNELTAVITTKVQGTVVTTDATETLLATYETTADDAENHYYFVDVIVTGADAAGNYYMSRKQVSIKHITSIWYVAFEDETYWISDFAANSTRIDAYDVAPGQIVILVTGDPSITINWTCEMIVKKMLVTV